MNKNEEWNQFLENLQDYAVKMYEKTTEYQYRTQRWTQLDQIMSDHLTNEQKQMMDEILFEAGLHNEQESQLLYRQGMKDCIWLLKNLGVLA